ncbi:MAG: glutaminyl-peptide cyclotransferase [Bacteroidales bacterium]|nr:glutaminyl-peptide cyclotransferase [Bacteroidales bacterium]
MKKIALIFCSLLIAACSEAQVVQYRPKVVKEYPHSVTAYTQGLFFHDGVLYESTGQYGGSAIRTVNLQDGKSIVEKKFNNKYFGEGSVILNGDLFILTWMNKVAFIYDAKTLTYKRTVSYPRQGWGLTTDGKQLIASDGSSNLYFMNTSLKLQKTLPVTLNGRPLRNLNELEWIDGKIWANVYLTDMIVIINPKNGKVEGKIDCTGLLPANLKTPDTDVLNGIAVDGKGHIFLTGKNWPRMYEIELIK